MKFFFAKILGVIKVHFFLALTAIVLLFVVTIRTASIGEIDDAIFIGFLIESSIVNRVKTVTTKIHFITLDQFHPFGISI